VQGVFFRSFVAETAEKLGVSGSVRNLPDGTVEVYAEGERVQLEELIKQLKTGPPAARVCKVTTDWSEYTGNYSGFRISY
jgi:acylphosphatase